MLNWLAVGLLAMSASGFLGMFVVNGHPGHAAVALFFTIFALKVPTRARDI